MPDEPRHLRPGRDSATLPPRPAVPGRGHPGCRPTPMPKAQKRPKRIAFVASTTEEATQAAERLIARYGTVPEADAEVIVALGGDGLMLQTLHRHMGQRIPIYGMNRGSVGFLMNDYAEDDLHARLDSAEVSTIHPLRATTRQPGGIVRQALAINEVSLLRQTHQAAKLRISVDGTVRMEELNGDGVLLATPAGSTAYNFSAFGAILPLTAQLLALTPLSPFRPRRWRGALLPSSAHVQIEVLDAAKRPVSATADNTEMRDIQEIAIRQASDIDLLMMFDAGRALDERILSEQFRY